MSHKDSVITTTGGVNISMFALVLTLIAYLCSVAGILIGAGYYQGRQIARIETLEAQKVNQDSINLRQISAMEAQAQAFQALAIRLEATWTVLNERTSQAVAQSRQSEAANRAAIAANREAIAAAKAAPATAKSRGLFIGIK